MLTWCLHLTKFAPVVTLILLLIAVSYITSIKPPGIDLNQALVSDSQVSIHMNPIPAIPEEEIWVTLSLKEHHTDTIIATTGYVEGINMYMGRTPILWEKAKGQSVRGRFMFGSCSEPVMQWRMLIELTLESGGKIQRIAEFSSMTEAAI